MRLFLNRLLILAAFFLTVFSQNAFAKAVDYSPYPNPGTGYVTDNINLFNASEEERIEQWLYQVETKSSVEIIIVVINSIKDYPKTDNESIESFATGLFNKYGIGNKVRNDGILLLVSKKDRKVRIELGKSYGYLHDQEAKQIIEHVILPEFRDKKFVAGITNGTKSIINEFTGLRVGFRWYLVWIFVAAIACLLIAVSYFKNGNKGWGYVFIGLAVILVLILFGLIFSSNGKSSSWASGGVGGFGGGSSGGGGATGGW